MWAAETATSNEVLRGDRKFWAEAVENACAETRDILEPLNLYGFRLRNYRVPNDSRSNALSLLFKFIWLTEF
jgi:hypothetical protein